MYASGLGDGIDLSNIGSQITTGLSTVAGNVLNQAEQGVSKAASAAVDTATNAAGTVLRNITGQAPSGSSATLPVSQPAERPVASAPAPAASTSTSTGIMSNAKGFIVPAAVGAGVYLWRKSIVWALGSAVAAHFIVPKLMQKGGNR